MSIGLLLSGGIDSSAVAFWKRPNICFTVNYGHRPAQAEIAAARHIAGQIGSRHEILTLDCSSMGSGDLAAKPALPSAPTPEWWPFRNQLLITFCAIRALELDIGELVLGSVRSDAIHGDGTEDFFDAMREALACQEGALKLSTPAIGMTSPEVVSASGIPMDSLLLTHSCHTGDLACGSCRGCQRRFATFQALGLETSTPAVQ
ncbi:MAG: 7-cyano-7-deazaguanine synthase [Bryobacterales bacterium]|nr:7-cyano-7-deazaguanine synthase [Bryobacterales bacterium]